MKSKNTLENRVKRDEILQDIEASRPVYDKFSQTQRWYIDLPYADKELVNQLGGRWDPTLGRWWVEQPLELVLEGTFRDELEAETLPKTCRRFAQVEVEVDRRYRYLTLPVRPRRFTDSELARASNWRDLGELRDLPWGERWNEERRREYGIQVEPLK